MESKDWTRLREICKANDFEIEGSWGQGVIVVKKKDPWDGVEFVKIRDGYTNPDYKAGKIYPLKGIDENGYFDTLFDEDGDDWNGLSEDEIIPSTESAYIEQLKKECFERFGEINHGDSFICPNGIKASITNLSRSIHFSYFKEDDRLEFLGFNLYEKGKWAQKVNKRVEVEWDCTSQGLTRIEAEFTFTLNQRKDLTDNKVGEFLAFQLEKYLNGELK